MRLSGSFSKHNHHYETKERGNGGHNLHENTDCGASELTPGVKDRRVEAIDAGHLISTIYFQAFYFGLQGFNFRFQCLNFLMVRSVIIAFSNPRRYL